MSYPIVLAVCGATLGGFFALLSLAFATAPGWRPLRWFALVAGSAGSYCACVAVESSTHDDRTAQITARLAVSLVAVNVVAWMRYSAARPPGRFERLLEAPALAVAGLALVPGALLGRVLVRHDGGWTQSGYVTVIPTTLGVVAFGVLFAIAAVPFARYMARWRTGVAGAGARALALGGLAATGAVDAVDSAWIRGWPHVAPLGLVLTVVIVGWSVARRFVGAACALDALSTRLDATVSQRNGELARARESLAHHEKLAVLGRLSGAVAHEINNPAAAVAANLGYMRDVLKSDGTGLADAAEVIKDTLESVDRIARIVQQLGDAGEFAIRGGASSAVGLAEAVRRAALDADPSIRDGVGLVLDIPEDVYVRMQEDSLRQVVTGLIVAAAGAMHAAKCSGRIRVEARRQEDHVALRVADPCPETDDVVRTRRFAPFVSLRPTTVAQGVGLSVSVVLLRIFGGDMTLESAGAEGSIVRIDLPGAEAPARKVNAPESSRSPRARVLLVDDDVLVRIGLRRLLGREYVLDEAGSVEEALTCVREHGEDLDAIVCDLVMPDGGAGRVLEGLERFSPHLARAMVIMTGGAVDEATQELLDAHAERVLRKPVDVGALRALIERLRRKAPSMGIPAPQSR